MNNYYFNNNFYKLKKVANEMDSFLRDHGIENTTYIKLIRNASLEILKNRQKILEFLQEKTTESFKDLGNSDLIIITLLNNYFKQAKRDSVEVQEISDNKKLKKFIADQEIPTIRKLLKEKKFEEIKDIIKEISKVRIEVALVVRPKKDSARILKMKILIEILYSIIQYEKAFIKSNNIVSELRNFNEEYKKYYELTDVNIVLDFKNFDASRWDRILVSNVDNIRSLIIDIKDENKGIEESFLDEKPIIVAINTINNLHDLLSELKKIKDVNTFHKYFKEKYAKFIPPIIKTYAENIDWSEVVKILKVAHWNDLLSYIPKKLQKQAKGK